MADQSSEPDSPPASFIVPMWAAIFRVLSFISPFWLLRRVIPRLCEEKCSYAVVEAWVVGHAGLALCAALLAYSGAASLLLTIVLVYGGLRVFEIVVTQTTFSSSTSGAHAKEAARTPCAATAGFSSFSSTTMPRSCSGSLQLSSLSTLGHGSSLMTRP